MSLYIIQYYGDLERDCGPCLQCFPSLKEALEHLAWTFDNPNQYPDPEDDRIVVWKADPGQQVNAVWHFSGWHWAGDASDLPGGPLENGTLPGDNKSLYDLCMADY